MAEVIDLRGAYQDVNTGPVPKAHDYKPEVVATRLRPSQSRVDPETTVAEVTFIYRKQEGGHGTKVVTRGYERIGS